MKINKNNKLNEIVIKKLLNKIIEVLDWLSANFFTRIPLIPHDEKIEKMLSIVNINDRIPNFSGPKYLITYEPTKKKVIIRIAFSRVSHEMFVAILFSFNII